MSNTAKLNEKGQETNQQAAYFEAREKELSGRMQPSKLSDWPLVSFVEVEGVVYPVYRKDS